MKVKRIFWMNIWVIVLGVVGLIIYGTLVEQNQVTINHLYLNNDILGTEFRGRIAVHLSDLHIKKIGRRERKVLAILDELKPDFIFLTGDYVSWDGDYETALKFFSKLKAKIGVWAVMGDYDYSNSRKSCLFCHEKGSGKPTQKYYVRFLRNSVEKINVSNGSFLLGGFDIETNRALLINQKLPFNKKNEPAIILSHNPLSFELFNEDQNVLILAGDTHGGQISLPSCLWELLGYEKCAKYREGFFKKGLKKMFVSRGIGTSHFSVRIFKRPEVVVLHF